MLEFIFRTFFLAFLLTKIKGEMITNDTSSRDDVFKDKWLAQKLSSTKTVNIKIGVLVGESRRNGNEDFWIEFDPTVRFKRPWHQRSNYNIILPYLVVPHERNTSSFHPFRKMPEAACSSIFEPSNTHPQLSSFTEEFRENCRVLNESTHGHLTLWEHPVTVEGAVAEASYVSHRCMTVSKLLGSPIRFNSISLLSVFRNLPMATPIGLLDIDAQGADVELLLTLGDHVRRVKTIKLECQTGMWMYKSNIPNNCTVAIEHLRDKHNFTLTRSEINNCGILEYNVLMKNNNAKV